MVVGNSEREPVLAKRDPERTRRLRVVVVLLIKRDQMEKGHQSRLAEIFKVSRQRVHQIVVEERNRPLHESEYQQLQQAS